MDFLPMTEYDSAGAEVRREYDDQIARNGRVTNMKRTLLHHPPSFRAYMEWYTLRDALVPVIGERGISLFCYAISAENNCLICSAFFRKILIDTGDDPDNPALSEQEQFLMDLGRAIAAAPHDISEKLYAEMKQRFSTEQTVLLVAFAGIMAATNLFNTVAKVPLDEVLYDYVKKEQ